MPILVEDGQTAFRHDAAKFLNEQRWIINERDHPTAPGEVVIARRQLISHQIDLVNLNVAKGAHVNHFSERICEIFRPLERDHSAMLPNDFTKIDSGVPGTGADIENAFASSDAGSFPAIQRDRAPDAVLQAEPGNLFLIRAENVMAIRRHTVTVADCGEITTR